MMKHRITLESCLFVLLLNLANQLLGSEVNESAEYDLALSIHCPEKDLKQGDEIPIVFTITNEGSPSEFGAH